MARFRCTPSIAIFLALGAPLVGCASSEARERGNAATQGDDAGSDASEVAACEAGAPSADGTCKVTPPVAPDCNAEPCTGALRWTRRIEVDDGRKARMFLTNAASDRGVALFIDGDRSTHFQGVPLLEDGDFDGAPQAYALLRLTAEGEIAERWPLPGAALSLNITGHAEAMIVLIRWGHYSLQPDFWAVSPGADASAYPLPSDVSRFTAQRERWLGVIVPPDVPSAECASVEGYLHRYEHTDLHGTKTLGKACGRGRRFFSQHVIMPSGGLAALLNGGSAVADFDFGMGLEQVGPDPHLVVWNADGSLRYTRPVGLRPVRLHVGGDDDVWALESTGALSARYLRFDASGELRNEGVTPDGSNPYTFRVDSTGYGLVVGSRGPGLGTVSKIAPDGAVIWQRELAADIDTGSLQVDSAGFSYVLSVDGTTLYQLEP